ncbi:MAG: response regulator transcription factor [Chloroflexi bacterium]|nr:response regulator transcription factor [Chloroflexota bacterium]
MTIRILVADDHPVVLDGLVAILSTQPDFEVVAAASSGAQALDLTMGLMPDVLMLDLEMPGMNGVDVLRELQTKAANVSAIVFTAFDTDENIFNAVQAGAKGYLLKGAPREELFRAIRVVNDGGSLLQPIVMNKLLQHIRQEREQPQRDSLSPRERDVLRLMARGLQNKEIAQELVITERTVKFHVSSILAKMHAGNRTEAVTIALQEGLIEP